MKVREKKVELIELFNDLIYVYAISRLTRLIENPEGGIIRPIRFFSYIVVCFVILQAWLWLTNYINRYSRWKWYEYGLTTVNMIAAIYMTNTISVNWNNMSTTFNLAMLTMLLCVAVLYFIQSRLKEQDPEAANNSLLILSIVCMLYFTAFIVFFFNMNPGFILIDAFAVIAGAFLPFFIRGKFDYSIISFPHLAERFELITIITFGEGVVGMTDFFDVNSFSLKPILVFSVILLLFGCYVLQIHYLCNTHRVDRALRLMFSHYFIVISINLVTVAFKFFENPESNRLFVATMMILAMLLFFIAIFSDSIYYSSSVKFTSKDATFSAFSLTIGAAIMILTRGTTFVFLIGALIASCGNFCMLLWKYRTQEV